MTKEEQEIVADLCEQMHDSLENPYRLAWKDVRELCGFALDKAKGLIDAPLLDERDINRTPEEEQL